MGGIWAVVAAILNGLVELAKYLATKPDKPEPDKAPTASSAEGALERAKKRSKAAKDPDTVKPTKADLQ